MKTSSIRNSIARSSSYCGTLSALLILLVLGWFWLVQQARATCQEGCLTNDNTVLGDDALLNNTGSANTAIGFNALISNTTGFYNTAIGGDVLLINTTGIYNTAIGFAALSSNTIATGNTATGVFALYSNTTGYSNIGSGVYALYSNDTGYENIASGNYALYSNTTGANNVASGEQTLYNNSTGTGNTAIGDRVLGLNTTGVSNTASGFRALSNLSSGDGNLAAGAFAGISLTSGSNDIYLANAGAGVESNTIRIGTEGTQTKTFVAGVRGTGVSGAAVKVNAAGQIGIAPSSQRFKDDIRPMDKTSEAILALKPVAFRYKKDVDPERTLQFGLVAEDVEKVNPELVFRDSEGKVYSVRYEAVNAMLLNEFLKARRQIDAQQKQIDALATGLQKVNAQLEVSKSAPQTVLNDQ